VFVGLSLVGLNEEMGLLWFQSNPIGSEGLCDGRGLGRPPEGFNTKELPSRMGAVESFNPLATVIREGTITDKFIE